MSTPKALPRHGTRARYRLELKVQPDGSKGVACDRCKAANSKAVAAARSRRAATARRTTMHIVDAPAADTDAVTTTDTPLTANVAGGDAPAELGPMELAITQDIDEIPDTMRVPMHRSLAVLAVQTARDFDTADTHTARASARRELADIIKSLRTRREGDGTTALDAFLDDFGSGPPQLPGRRA